MITFILTGNICCGKSTATNTFRSNGIPIVDADIVSRQVVAKGTTGLQTVIDAFGSEYLLSDGTLDRQKLGNFIFYTQEALLTLNGILHPLIRIEAAAQLKAFHDCGYQIVGYDVALIAPDNEYKPIIIVKCTPEQQLARLMKRGMGHGTLTEGQALSIISKQPSMEERVASADFIIDTSGSIEDSAKQTETTIYCLKIMLRDQKMKAEGK